MKTRLVCRHCRVPVGLWFYGWKHQNGGGGRPSCGRKLTALDVVEEVT